MGVKGLWTLLGPFCERKPLYEIRGETVAVDLSGWVCDSQNVTDNFAQPRLYLRNLYFRTSYLLLCGVTPVFVLEGAAPALKGATMAARAELQAQARGGPARRGKQDMSRKRFATILAHCEKLLSSMGVQCVTGAGEAEAMCAHLNSSGVVSAVISQDSDCFVYGATRLYRNFTVSGAGSGTVDVYDLARIQKSIDLGRNKMVALALLCGSDYNGSGVDGVGHATACSFLQQHSDRDIIGRLVSWSVEPEQYEKYKRRVEDVTSCTTCGHGGSSRLHVRRGCAACATHTSCHSNGYREWRQNMKVELQLRARALAASEAFPDPALLREFLEHEESTPAGFCPRWGRPDLIKFTKLMKHWLCWEESYCVEKFLPIVTRWQLLHSRTGPLRPRCIKKKRNPKGVACYEVVWEDPEELYCGLVTDDQVRGENALQDLWTTVERQDLVESAFPLLVEEFRAAQAARKGGKKRKAEKAEVSFKTKSRKTRKKMNEIKNNSMQKKMDCYLAKSKSGDRAVSRDVGRVRNTSGTAQGMSPLLRRKLHLFCDMDTTADLLKNMSCEATDEEVSEGELSNIVDNIINRNNYLDFEAADFQMVEYAANFSTPVKSKEEIRSSGPIKRRVSHFFGALDDDYDAFEKSMDLKNAPDCDATVEYDLANYSPILKKNRVVQCPAPEDLGNSDCRERPAVKKRVLSLEERLFGNVEGGCEAEEVDITSPARDSSECSAAYTPLLERIRRAKRI